MTAALAEPTPVAIAIAKINGVADLIAAKVPASPNGRRVLSYQEWHDLLNALAAAQGWLRTEQVIARRAR